MSKLFQTGHPDADQLSAFAENALPPHEREALLAHMAVCAECREVVALSLPPMEVAPAVPGRRRWFSGFNLIWPAAALAAAAALLVSVRHIAVSRHDANMPSQVAEVHAPATPAASANTPEPVVSPTAQSVKPRSAVRDKKEPADQRPGGVAGDLGAEQFALQDAQVVTGRDVAQLPPTASQPMEAHGNAINGLPRGSAAGGATQFHGDSVGQYAVSQAPGNAPNVPRSGGQLGIVGSAMPQTATVAPAALKPAASNDVTAANAATGASLDSLSDAALAGIIAPHLPGGAAVLSTAVRGRQMIAIDAKNAVFLSNDSGVNWVAVSVPWKGRAVRAQLVSLPILGRAMYAQVEVADQNMATETSAASAPVAKTSAKSLPARAATAPLPASPPSAPAPPGSLSGVVTDLTGAAIPDATISITGANAQVLKTVKTGRDGRYVMEDLAPGSYKLEAFAQGFQSAVQPAVPIERTAPSVRNLTLQLGAASETVNVTSAPSAIKLESAPALRAGIVSAGQPQLFAITTDAGERWTSSDGVTWRRQ